MKFPNPQKVNIQSPHIAISLLTFLGVIKLLQTLTIVKLF